MPTTGRYSRRSHPKPRRLSPSGRCERDKAVQSKATEAAEAKRVAAQAEDAISQLNQQYAAQLQQFLSTQTVAEPDEVLLETDPVEYLRQERAYRNAAAQRHYAQQQVNAVARDSAQRASAAEAARQSEQVAILAERIPEWSDDAARAKIVSEITDLATAHGYDAERLSKVDAADVLFLREASAWKAKADKFDKLVSDKMVAVRAAKELPRVSRPGAAQAQRVPAADRRASAAMDELRTTGRTRDPSALFLEYI